MTDEAVHADQPDQPGLTSRAMRQVIKAYQAARSGHPSPCRFYPTCSSYAVEALERHGAWRGSRLAMRRILRCHPLGGHGVDLVPLELRRGR